jgi:predicted dehydrogenase
MKVALVGCGRIAKTHVETCRKLGNLEVVAVADADLNRAKSFAESYNIEGAFSNYKDLFELKDIAFLDICTPTSTHETIVRDAARAGLNVLMEKPMGRNSEECGRMIDESRKQGTKICVCHNQLFYPFVRRLKTIADSEGFHLTCFRTSHRENFEWLKAHGLAQPWNVSPENGGILWEVGTHLAYLQLHFLKDIKEVYALGAKSEFTVWDDFVVLLRTSSQRWGVLEISWIAQEPEMVYEISSSNGKRVQAYLPHGYEIQRTQEAAGNLAGVIQNWLTDEKRIFGKWWKFAKDHLEKPQTGHFDLIKNYAESLEKGLPSPVTGEDGRNAVRLLECIDESLRKQCPIEFSAWQN